MTTSDPALATWLPLLVVAVVLALRFRTLSRARPFRPGRLWIQPLFLAVIVGTMLLGAPPVFNGWLALVAGLASGAMIGWRRGHLMHLDRDPRSGGLTIRQTPAAFFLIIALMVMKRLLAPNPAVGPAGHLPPQALLVTDGLVGLALGMVLATNLTLGLRARDIPLQHVEIPES